MKKYKYYLIIVLILMIIPMILKTITKHHKVEYVYDKYKITETFDVTKDGHHYDILIKHNNKQFSYTLKQNLGKRKKIIKEIRLYKKDNITCIMPIYKKKIKLNLYCSENNQQVSNYYLKDNQNYKSILNKVKKYKVKVPKTSNKTTKYKKLQVYKDNINDDNAFILWGYKGIYILKNNSIKYQKILDYDLYDNLMFTVTSKYFVLFDNHDVMGIEDIHYYDIKSDKYKKYKLKEKLSKDSYINGVVDDLIYVTDNKNKKEYTINLKKRRVEEIGNEENGYIKYVNSDKQILNKSDFFMHKQLFNNEMIKDKNITKSKDLIKEGKYYYFIEDGIIYKQLNSYNKQLLFKLNDISFWYVYNDNILLISNDILYLYNDINGLNKIVKYNELKYNGENIVKFWES